MGMTFSRQIKKQKKLTMSCMMLMHERRIMQVLNTRTSSPRKVVLYSARLFVGVGLSGSVREALREEKSGKTAFAVSGDVMRAKLKYEPAA
jgi:hypothetical protein